MDGPIAIARYMPRVEVSVEDARETVAVGNRIAGGRPCPVLVDMRHVRSFSVDARQYIASAERLTLSRAVGIVVGSPLSRVIGNFVIGRNETATPSRCFTSRSEARAWLHQYVQAAA